MVAAILQQAGYKTGLYTSPHLKDFRERIRVNGQLISAEFIIRFVNSVKPIIHQIHPSFFECTVAMALSYFAESQVDIAVIEVGMGGRLDSTNVITPEVSLITNISYDHQRFLGDTLPKIANEKAGIIKSGVPVVIGEYQAEVMPVYIDKAISENADLLLSSDFYKVQMHQLADGYRRYTVYNQITGKAFELQLDLLGTYQQKNLPGVLKVADVLKQRGFNIELHHIQQALAQVVALTGLKGRWQILSKSPLIVCDTGHNEAGIHEVMQNIAATPHRRLFMIMGMVADKEHEKILQMLPKDAYYYFTAPSVMRALPAQQLFEIAQKFKLQGEIAQDVNHALSKAKSVAESNDLIFIGGSTFTVADIEQL